jgi:hypothetical protein
MGTGGLTGRTSFVTVTEAVAGPVARGGMMRGPEFVAIVRSYA